MFKEIFESGNATELVQIAGLIRFSYPGEDGGGFKARYHDREKQLAKLFADERMEERLRLFEKLCFHSMRRQSQKNFSVGVLIGKDMPEKYRTRLERMVAEVPQVKIISLPILPFQEAIKQAYDQLFDEKKPFRLSFRLDDDDALSLDYIERVNDYLPYLIMLSAGISPVCLSFSSGLIMGGVAGEHKFLTQKYISPLGLGAAVLAPERWSGNVYSTIHPLLHTRMKTIFDPTEVVMLRTYHESNDSTGAMKKRMKRLDATAARIILRERFELDIDELQAM